MNELAFAAPGASGPLAAWTDGFSSAAWRWLGAIAVERALGRSVLAKLVTERGSGGELDLDEWLAASVEAGLLVSLGVPSLFRVTASPTREPLYAVHPDRAELVLRALAASGDLEDIAVETRSLLEARSVSDIAIALQRGDAAALTRSFAMRRAPRDPPMEPDADWLRRSVCEPFDSAWLVRAWGEDAVRIGERVLRESLHALAPTFALRAWLEESLATMTPGTKAHAELASTLAEHALLSKDTKSIEANIADLGPATRLGFEAARRFIDGDLAGARELVARAVGSDAIGEKVGRGAAMGRSSAAPRCGAVAPVLALIALAREGRAEETQAKRFLLGTTDSDRASARAFRTLLRYLGEPNAHHRRIDVHQMGSDAGAWEILLSALTVHLHFDRPSSRASWAQLLVRKAQTWGRAGYVFMAEAALLLARDLEPHYAHTEAERIGLDDTLPLRVVSLWDLVGKKPEWEKTLRALLEITETASEPAETSYRAAFYLDMVDGSFARPLLQESRRGGAFSQGRRLSIAELYEERDHLPPEDARVLSCSRETRDGKRELTPEAYEMLIGHPRVYNGMRGGASVTVLGGSCRVETERDGGYIRVVVEPEGARLGINVVCETDVRLVVYRVSAAMKRVIDVLPHGVRVPREREAEVVRVLAKLAESVEVRSPELGAEREVTADATPCVRFAPRSGAWLVELGIRPFGPRGRFFPAGYGRASVTSTVDGQRLRSERDLDLERTRVDALIRACPTLARDPEEHEEEGDDADQWIFGEESVLSLLSELAAGAIVCELEWPESTSLRLRGNVSSKTLHGSLRSLKGWYIATGGVRIDDVTEVALADLVRAPSIASGRFIRLASGDYLEVEKRVRSVVRALSAMSVGKGTHREVRIHPGAIATLRELGRAESGLTIDPAANEWLTRVDSLSQKAFPIPDGLLAELRPYQVEGFRWLSRLSELGLGACLADDMGLGKTVQIIALLLARADEGPALVVAPTSVTMNWVREMQRFAPSLEPVLYGGPGRVEALVEVATNGRRKVVVASYAILQEDQAALAAMTWTTAVLDEAQFIKNPESQRARAAFRLSAKQRIAATGTPVENHFGDLWSIFHFLNPGLLGEWPDFNRRFVRPIERDGDTAPEGVLRALVKPYLLRRLKRDVLVDLPPLTEVRHEVELSRDHALRYGFLRKQIHDKLFTAHGKRHNKIEVLAEITRLRRFCCHPKLVFPDADNESAKIQAFLELATELCENGHRALVFSQYVDFLRFVRDELDELGISYEYLDGSTPQEERQKRVDAFQNGQSSLFLVSLKAGGFGLNLTAADYVIHLDPWWNPAVEAQATDRAHRIGQSRRVTVYRLITKNTIEENIVALHTKKRKLAQSLLEGTGDAARLSSEDLLRLIDGGPASDE